MPQQAVIGAPKANVQEGTTPARALPVKVAPACGGNTDITHECNGLQNTLSGPAPWERPGSQPVMAANQ